MSATKVLIIEDEAAVANLLCEGLRSCGYEAEAADGGDRGLTSFMTGQHDVVVTDVFMPGREGLEVLMEVKRASPEAKVVAISGGGHMFQAGPVLSMAKKLGADAVLNKPFRLQQLVDVIEQLGERAGKAPN